MNAIERTLSNIDGGRILDVATQNGHFTQILRKYLRSYTEIIGVDIDENTIKVAMSAYGRDDIHFLVMDAEQLDFDDARFDTVTISASLHHLSNIPQVLAEMVRVLKPGGHFILVEMYRDGQTEAELTSVYLHAWVGAVDSALGIFHNRTLARQEFEDYVTSLELSNVAIYDDRELDSNPKEQARIEHLDDLIEKTMERAESTPNHIELKKRGEQLRHRLHKIGAQREPIILIVGKK